MCPRYFASDEQISEHVEFRIFERTFDSWVPSFRE